VHLITVANDAGPCGLGREILSARQVCTRKIASILTDQVIKLAGRERTGRVIIVGCEHIELLIQLAQHGFVDVTCRSLLIGPNAGEMTADIMIAPAVDREPELAAVLSRLAHGLRPDGALFLVTTSSLITTRMRQIQKLLKQSGFTFVRMHLAPADTELLYCRRISALQARAA
jgi:hypothetical protein